MTPSTIFQQIHLGRASRDSWILPWHIAAPWTPCPVASTNGTFRLSYGKAKWKRAHLAILGRDMFKNTFWKWDWEANLCGGLDPVFWMGCSTVDGRNPASQLRLVLYPMIYKALYIPGGCLGFLPSTVLLGNLTWVLVEIRRLKSPKANFHQLE